MTRGSKRPATRGVVVEHLSIKRQSSMELIDCALEDGGIVECPGEDDRALDGENGVFRKQARLLSVPALPHERCLQGVHPGDEVTPDSLREEVSGVGDSQSTDETDAPARSEVFRSFIEHRRDSGVGIVPISQGRIDGILKPLLDFGEHSPDHLLFPIREEVVQAALAQASGLADQGKARTFVSMLAKNFGQGGNGIGSFSDHAGHDQRPRSLRLAWSSGRRPSVQKNRRSLSAIGISLMHAWRCAIRPSSANSQFSLP